MALGYYRTVPTEDDIMVPETLLKKRKSQEKAREERSAAQDKKKKVRQIIRGTWTEGLHDGDDKHHPYD